MATTPRTTRIPPAQGREENVGRLHALQAPGCRSTLLHRRSSVFREHMMRIPTLLLLTVKAWSAHDGSRLGASLAYYAVFSIPPLLTVMIGIAGIAFGKQAVEGELMSVVAQFAGDRGAQIIQTILASASEQGGGVFATVVGTVLLMAGATGVFAELQHSLNTIWRAGAPEQTGIWSMVKDRFVSMLLVLVTGLLLILSLIATATIASVGDAVSTALPGGALLWQAVNQVISLAVTAAVFATLYKFLPDTHVLWQDAVPGAALGAVLFSAGRFLLGQSIGMTPVVSAYGAAGSVIALLLWLYVSAQIFFLGAEFSCVLATNRSLAAPSSKPAQRSPGRRVEDRVLNAPQRRVHA